MSESRNGEKRRESYKAIKKEYRKGFLEAKKEGDSQLIEEVITDIFRSDLINKFDIDDLYDVFKPENEGSNTPESCQDLSPTTRFSEVNHSMEKKGGEE